MKRVETDTGYDGIKLESRSEVGKLEEILNEWMRAHPGDEKTPIAERIANVLNVMWYEW